MSDTTRVYHQEYIILCTLLVPYMHTVNHYQNQFEHCHHENTHIMYCLLPPPQWIFAVPPWEDSMHKGWCLWVTLHTYLESLLHSASMARRKNLARWRVLSVCSPFPLRQPWMVAFRYSKREGAVGPSALPPLARCSAITQSHACMESNVYPSK